MNRVQPRTVMAFDFGIKNIGIAIGQEITKTASTFYSLKALKGEPDWDELDKIVAEWKPNLFIVGDPYNMDGTRSYMQDLSDNFTVALNNRYSIILRRLMKDYLQEKPRRGYKILILVREIRLINIVFLLRLF